MNTSVDSEAHLNAKLVLYPVRKQKCHLSYIQQVDLEEEAQSGSCDLVGGPTDGVAQFAPHGQTISLDHSLEDGGGV